MIRERVLDKAVLLFDLILLTLSIKYDKSKSKFQSLVCHQDSRILIQTLKKRNSYFRKMTPVVCDRNKYGHCKFGAFCKYTFAKEIKVYMSVFIESMVNCIAVSPNAKL